MITFFIVAIFGAAGGLAAFIASAAVYLPYRAWREHQRNIGYSRGALDQVLATPDEARHYGAVVGAIPGAEHVAETRWERS